MSMLFSRFKLRSIECKNRIFLSPMCQYSSEDDMPNDWRLVHLGSRAAGGMAQVMVEATGDIVLLHIVRPAPICSFVTPFNPSPS